MDGDELDAYLSKYRAEVRRETLLEAAKAVCKGCKAGEILFMNHDEDYFHETTGSWVWCDADAIHKLIAADQGQGQGQEGK